MPSGALQVERRGRETVFTVSDFSPALVQSLTGDGRRVAADSLGLEDIFVDLAQSHMEATG